MTPGAEIDVETLRQLVTGLVALATGLAIVIWYLSGQLDRGCASCPHCLNILKRRSEEEEAKRIANVQKNLRYLGVSQEDIDKEMDKHKGK